MFKKLGTLLLGVVIHFSAQAAEGLQAVIFDWAGTTQDYGCRAPMEAFKKVFAEEGVFLSDAEVRVPMGTHKRKHIEMITQLPPMDVNNLAVASRWEKTHAGKSPKPADVDRLFARFIPLQLATIREYSDLIPGTVDTVAYIRSKGWKVGSTTGYTKDMLDIVLAASKERGYAPDFAVASDMVPQGRPYPDMILKNCEVFGVDPKRIVNVDDTLPGIEAGHRAGAWTVLVMQSGSQLGLSQSEIQQLTAAQLAEKLKAADSQIHTYVHYKIPTIAELPPVLDAIDQLLRAGHSPEEFSAKHPTPAV